MPKKYDNLREHILCAAKEALLRNGYDALTVRGIAAECGIAVGTVYNYFPSKEMLAASVMLADWLLILERMRAECERAETVRGGLTAIYEGVTAYTGMFHAVWADYTFTKGAKTDVGRRHILLVRQLADIIANLFDRLGEGSSPDTAVFFAESILTCAGSSELTFDALVAVTRPILSQITTQKEETHVQLQEPAHR